MIQDLLYLQAGNTSVTSQVLGIALVRGGEVVDVPREPADWPYQTVTDALKDGWRVIKFPSWPCSSMSRAIMRSVASSFWRSCGMTPPRASGRRRWRGRLSPHVGIHRLLSTSTTRETSRPLARSATDALWPGGAHFGLPRIDGNTLSCVQAPRPI